MGSDLYVAASGAIARLRDLDIVANNLANVDTAGFKRDIPVFEAVLQSALRDAEGRTTWGAPARAFVDTQIVASDFRAGPVAPTGAALDAAIIGEGFFEVETPEGLRYTRAGSFVVNADGQIATPDGFPVMGEGGPIALDGAAASILATGEVMSNTGESLGRLKVVAFDELGALRKTGLNFFEVAAHAAPRPVLEPEFATGNVERSNVVPVRELGALVILQRAFDLNVQAIQKDDESTQNLIREFQQ